MTWPEKVENKSLFCAEFSLRNAQLRDIVIYPDSQAYFLLS